jgi:lycopene beta-cyclase
MNPAAPDSHPTYDYLLVGGGAAGLSLAYHVAQEPRLAGKRVLLIEPVAKDQNDRTWSFWADAPGLFDAVATREWHKIAFRSPGFERTFDLKKYTYRTLRGLDFYQFVHRALGARPAQFTLVRGEVADLVNTAAGVQARTTTGQVYTAHYAFDSRPPAIEPQPSTHRYLLQHFVGWEVETTHDVFDPQVMAPSTTKRALYTCYPLAHAERWSSTRFSRLLLWTKRRTRRALSITFSIP